jgi:hypothetical protein
LLGIFHESLSVFIRVHPRPDKIFGCGSAALSSSVSNKNFWSRRCRAVTSVAEMLLKKEIGNADF